MTVSYDLIIFDCDGVLIDSEPLASRTMAEALSDAGIAMSQKTALDVFTGKSEKDIRADLFTRGIADYEAFAVSWRERLFKSFASDLKPMQGIVALIEALGAPKCVASNSSRNRLEQSLGKTVLWEQFAPHIYSAEDVERPKPFPDLVLHCLARCNARPEKTIMIDDSAHGITATLLAGARPVGFVDPSDPRPDREKVLRAAGAEIVATGAAELYRSLEALSVPFRSSQCPK